MCRSHRERSREFRLQPGPSSKQRQRPQVKTLVASSEGVEAAIDFVRHYFYELQVGVQARLYVYLAGFAFSFAHIQQGVEGRGVGARESSHCGDGFALRGGHGLAQGPKSVAEQGAERGDGLRHDAQVRFVTQGRGKDRLAQAQPIGAQFAFDLQAMQAQGNFKVGEEISAEEQAVVLGDVEKLDREDVRGFVEFIKREEQRRWIALAYPPFRGIVEMLEIFGASALDDAENVQVGMSGAEFGGDGRAVEHDGFQIGFRRGFQTSYEFS
jgi:hypothetical protein